ncbi:MAG: hypothetical protein OEX22_11410 [Cyclobacteriaceae bacterium]|nr:hypothetical protein [Cyclobacteriaceae bacterium]
MKRVLLIIVVALALVFSCNVDSNEEREELLSSITWTIMQESMSNSETPNRKATYNFRNDGTYLLKAGDIEINGKWSWVKNDEIFLEVKELTFNDEETQFDAKSINYYIRVIELSEKVFKTLERHEGDDWDSGFVKEVNYIPVEL